MLTTQPNILLISGSGQNTGKTTLVCKLIETFSTMARVVAVKITHHFYTLTYPMSEIANNNSYIIYEETNRDMPKDSSRMLNAGAYKVFFIMAKKESTGIAVKHLLEILGKNIAIICESGGLADFYKPGLHLHLTGNENTNPKPDRSYDIDVSFDGNSFSLNMNQIHFVNNSWKQIQ